MKRLSKTLALLLITISVLGTVPQKTKAVIPVIDAANQTVSWLQQASNSISAAVDTWDKSNSVLVMALKRVAAKVLLKTTQRIVNWGTTGFQGNPFYVQDQGSFFRSIADQQLANTVDEVLKEKCAGATCPYARTTAKALIKGYANEQTGIKYNLNEILGTTNAEKCKEGEIGAGGWTCINALTQNPQNNFLGAYIEASREISDRTQEAIQGQKEELMQNNGFLSLRVCAEKKPKNARGDTLEVGGGTRTYPHTTLSGKQVFCVENPNSQAELWKCAGTCTPRDKELSETVRTQWEARKCYDKKSTEVTDITAGLGIGNSTLGAGALGLNGDIKADDCARYETQTPGNLIKSQLDKALLIPIEDKLNAKSSGGTIVDMLVDLTANLLDKGLSSLVSKNTTRRQIAQNSSSGGNVFLGNTTSTWYTGNLDSGLKLEDEINPGNPSTTLTEAIRLTEEELVVLNQIRTKSIRVPEETMRLDRCLPGPDVGWEQRLREEFQEETRRLERIAEKDNNRGDRAEETLRQLKLFLEEQIQKTKFGLIGVNGVNIPSASIILSRIAEKDAFISRAEEVNTRIAKKTSVLAILQDIERSIRSHPSSVASGQFVVNPSQNIGELRSRFRQIERDIGNEESLLDVKGELDIFNQDFTRSFDRTSSDSLISRCTDERAQAPDISSKDSAQKLFCEWDSLQTGTIGASGSSYIIPLFGLFSGLNIIPNIKCDTYYQSNLGNYIR